jgi:signal transduction histidine kinase
VGRVADLVRAMKEFGFPGSGTMAPADLNRAVRNTLVVSRPSWKYVATVSFEEGPLPSVVCHVEQLSQVLLNLVVNAADAIRERGEGAPPGHIVVRTGLDGADALLQVEDSGVGIATEHQARLFQPFFTTKEPGRGTGQGLALSRHIVVETHHGALTFTSTPGVGSTFTVRVPVAGAPRAPSTAPTSLQAVG